MTFQRVCKFLLPTLAMIGAVAVPSLAARTHRSATAGHSRAGHRKPASHQLHGQRQIDSDRAREIQGALIREHYLSGSPTGEWDAESQAAMSKFQADQGWQSKLTPDSRALIKLGLGPNQENAKTPGNEALAPSEVSGSPAATPGGSSLLAPQTVAQ